MRRNLVLALSLSLSLLGAACGEGSASPDGTTKPASTGAASGSKPGSSGAPVASGSGAPAPSGSASAPAAKKAHNVILITLDAVRADMPWQGYERQIAPNLTKLAKTGTVYKHAYAVSSYTAKSMGSLFSGRYPSTLYRDGAFFTKYSKANLWFTETLHDAGVHTIGITAHKYFDQGHNIGQGFDVWRLPDGLEFDPETDQNITSPDMTKLGTEILGDAKNTDGRFFAWLHYGDPHDKYKLHPESPTYGSKGRDLYDNEIHFTDMWIQKLLDFCATQPWWKDTIVIVSADHGEAFGEHKQYFHGFALWEHLVRVPLIFAGPGIAAREVDLRRSHIDLAPTILELLGVEAKGELHGKSLVPELTGAEPPADREPILCDLPADKYNPPTRVIELGDFKLIEDPGPKYHLYNVTADPGELKDLAEDPKSKAKFDEMKKAFDAAWSKYPLVLPFGGKDLIGGGKAKGPVGPEGWGDNPDADGPGKPGKAGP